MTSAPANLLAVRRLLLTYLNVDPNTERSQDLEPGEVGIVGNAAHRGGYHCGSDRVVTNDYSVVESPRDRAGLGSDAAALDVGLFQVQAGGRTHNLVTFSTWLVGQCAADAPDTRDIREVIYSPDGRTVKRWDRLRKRSTGDDSHLFHTHISYFRDAIKAGRDQTPVFHRYLTTIGLERDDDMTPEDLMKADVLPWVDGAQYSVGGALYDTARRVIEVRDQLSRMEAALTLLSGKDFTDEAAIVQGMLTGLTPEKIAAAIPPTLAKQVADELARRLVGGTQTAS